MSFSQMSLHELPYWSVYSLRAVLSLAQLLAVGVAARVVVGEGAAPGGQRGLAAALVQPGLADARAAHALCTRAWAPAGRGKRHMGWHNRPQSEQWAGHVLHEAPAARLCNHSGQHADQAGPHRHSRPCELVCWSSLEAITDLRHRRNSAWGIEVQDELWKKRDGSQEEAGRDGDGIGARFTRRAEGQRTAPGAGRRASSWPVRSGRSRSAKVGGWRSAEPQ